MGTNARSRMLIRAAGLVLLCAWGVCGNEVKLLNDQGGLPPSDGETRFDDGADINNPTSLFPGPRYGLPGYKESHNWVSDYDVFSPLIFDAKYYALRYGLKDQSENAVRSDWKAFLDNEANGYPKDCRQGNPLFSPQKYYRANPHIKESLDMNDGGVETCGSIVRTFMKEGLLENQARIDVAKEKEAYGEDPAQIQSEELAVQIARVSNNKRRLAWPIGQDFEPFGTQTMSADEQYTLTFWYRAMGAREPECNILHHGDNLNENSPRISQSPGGANRLKFVVSQTNDNTYSCEASQELIEKQWTFVSLVVGKSNMTVSYDGQEVCSKINSGGSTLVLPGRNFYSSSPFQPPADGEIQKIQFYPEHIVMDSLVEYSMEQQEQRLEKLK